MERVLTPDEKLKRAEEMYYRRREEVVKQNNKKTVSVPVSNKKYLLKKMIIQIVICFIIYCSYYVIKNFNFLFSKDVIDTTKDVLSYDIDVQDMYNKAENYINNNLYFKQQDSEESIHNESIEEEIIKEDSNDISNENTENSADTDEEKEIVASAQISEDEEKKDSSLSQMEIDANVIKQNYSLINPLKGQITSRFGPREQTEPIVSAYHIGLDIAANTGTVIVASMEGKVVTSGEVNGYGKCVQIQNDDILTVYGHCSKLYVNVGDNITQGQQLGEVGATRKCNRTTFAF